MKRTILILNILSFCTLISCSSPNALQDDNVSKLKRTLLAGKNYLAKDLTFTGPIDFDSLLANQKPFSPHITSELRFINCRFEGPFIGKTQDGRLLNFHRDVIFENCHFVEKVIVNDAVFHSRFHMSNSFFRKSVDLQRNSFRSVCRLDKNQIGHDLVLQYGRFHESLSLFTNDVGNHILMQGCSTTGYLQLSNTTFNGTLDLSNGNFMDGVQMDYLEGGEKILAGNSRFNRRLSMRDVSVDSLIKLTRCEILGNYTFSSKNNSVQPDITGTFLLRDGARLNR